MDVCVLDGWIVVDKWWTESPIRRSFAVVRWMGRELVFVRTSDDPVWRIHGPNI